MSPMVHCFFPPFFFLQARNSLSLSALPLQRGRLYMWSFCKRASGSRRAGKPGAESRASCECRSFQPALDPLTPHERASCLCPPTPNNTGWARPLFVSKTTLQQSFKCVGLSTHTERHKLNSLAAGDGRQADLCGEKVLDMVEGDKREGKPDMESLSRAWSVHFPCHVQYIM